MADTKAAAADTKAHGAAKQPKRCRRRPGRRQGHQAHRLRSGPQREPGQLHVRQVRRCRPRRRRGSTSWSSQLKADPKGAYFEIEGHTDNVGDKALNQKLGMDRAEAVKMYLYEQHQIPLHQMNVISYGEEKPAGAEQHARTTARRTAAWSSASSRKAVRPHTRRRVRWDPPPFFFVRVRQGGFGLASVGRRPTFAYRTYVLRRPCKLLVRGL